MDTNVPGGEQVAVEDVEKLAYVDDGEPEPGAGRRVGLVLSGGGARGAYEVGVLSVLMPELQRLGMLPRIIVGTSIGALNATYLAAGAATADGGLTAAVIEGEQMWRERRYSDVVRSLVSWPEVRRLLHFGAEFLGVPVRGVESVLDSSPLRETLAKLVDFDKIAANVTAKEIDAAAVVATSYDTGRSVVFHDGGRSPLADDVRGIDYAQTRLEAQHVLASSAIEALFGAVEVTEPPGADGWYGDGGVSLNTPLKPALELGAERLVVIGLNSSARPASGVAKRPPDAFDGAALIAQALLTDQLASDVATLATINRIIPPGAQRAAGASGRPYQRVPYIFVAPEDRFAIGRLASETYRMHYASLGALLGSRHDLALLGRILDAGRNPARGELLSYLFIAPEFVEKLLEMGRDDARRWLATQHDDGPWQIDSAPGGGVSPVGSGAGSGRRARPVGAAA
jgi:NTE family protein